MISNVSFYEKCTDENVTELINVFETKFRTSSKWSLEEVKISEIIPLCKYVYDERLKFAQISILNCKQYDIPLFYPYVVHYDNGDEQLVVPPIVEERKQLLYLGDGMHRIYSLIKLDVLTVFVLVTHECVLPFPGKPQTWHNVKRNPVQLPCCMNFENYLKKGLTGYSKFCNSDVFWRFLEEKGEQ